MGHCANLMSASCPWGYNSGDYLVRDFAPFEGEAARECLVSPSTRHLVPRSGGCRRELLSGARVHRQNKRKVLTCGFHSTSPGKILSVDIHRNSLSNDLNAFTAPTPVLTSGHQYQRQSDGKDAGPLEIHRGLTAHEEPTPLAEVFGDDE